MYVDGTNLSPGDAAAWAIGGLIVGVTLPDPGVAYRLLAGVFAAVTAWLSWRIKP